MIILEEFTLIPGSTDAAVLSAIRNKLELKNQTVAQAIKERELYFRVSLVGSCNLSCPFCHNEGAPTKGKMDLDFAQKAMKAAYEVGFRRVQFTGGEPLLHPKVHEFVRVARQTYEDVGITTNGSFLEQKVDKLIEAGIVRVHVSLQVEALRAAGSVDQWGIPKWLAPILDLSKAGYFELRLNMPVPVEEINRAEEFLKNLSSFGCSVKVFSILPDSSTCLSTSSPIQQLEELVTRENERRERYNLSGRLLLRGYRPPIGVRCSNCEAFDRCKEQSHSLRLGSDKILRPCLATRVWDIQVDENQLLQQLEVASLLALDF